VAARTAAMGLHFVLTRCYRVLDRRPPPRPDLGRASFARPSSGLTVFHGAHVTGGVLCSSARRARLSGQARPARLHEGRDRGPVLALRRHRVDRDLHHHLPHPRARHGRSSAPMPATHVVWGGQHHRPDVGGGGGGLHPGGDRAGPHHRVGSRPSTSPDPEPGPGHQPARMSR